MNSYGVIACWIFLTFLCQTKAGDPCNNYTVLQDSRYRGTRCLSIAGRDICDKYITPQWYRVEDDAELVTEEVKINTCGTTFPIWMPETLPKNGAEKNATVCINKGYTGGCEEELAIKIKHCDSYYVYYLRPPDDCPTSYCFGVNKSCPPFEACDKHYHDVLRNADERTFCGGENPGWYVLPRNVEMHTKCHPNAGKAMWINGSNVNTGGVFDAQVCFQNGDLCCESNADVQIKNCSGSLVFNITGGANCFSSDALFWTSWNNGTKSGSSACSLNLLWIVLLFRELLMGCTKFSI